MLSGHMPWGVLGLEPTGDKGAIRKNYAALIRQWRPDTHPLEFARVREAYEMAMQQAPYYVEMEDDETVDAEEAPVAVASPAETGPADANEPPAVVHIPALFVETVRPPAAAEPEVHIPERTPSAEATDIQATAQERHDVPHVDAAALAQDLLLHARTGTGESIAVRLRNDLRRCDGATIDARMDYEWELVAGLLHDDEPPLALVFEAARQLQWTDDLADVRQQLGAAAAQRLAVLVEMADHYVFSTRYSSNPWHARLFAPAGARISWLAVKALINELPAGIAQWEAWCAQAGLPALMGMLNVDTLRRSAGVAVFSTDLIVGLWVGWMLGFDASSRPFAVSFGYMLAGLAATVALCMAARWLAKLRWVRWLWRWRYLVSLDNGRGFAIVIVFVVLVIVSIFKAGSEAPLLARVPALTFLGILSVLVISGIAVFSWFALFVSEVLLLSLVLRPLAGTDRQAFEAMRSAPGTAWLRPSFKTRMRSVPVLWARSKAEKAAAKARMAERRKLGLETGIGFPAWLLLLIVVIIGNVIARMSK
ncbi:MAG: hypothetical protein EOO28_36330 [Comamonadaceae bacterium]|nr:MAG: hypothetical protein EOO28_36330 [Comamonadaceae bacterium]